MKSPKKLDRSLGVAALALLAIGHATAGVVFAYTGGLMIVIRAAFQSEATSAASLVTPLLGLAAFVMSGPLLHCSSIIGRPGTSRFVLGTLAATALLDTPVFASALAAAAEGSQGSMKWLMGFAALFAVIVHTVWTHERARRTPTVAATA